MGISIEAITTLTMALNSSGASKVVQFKLVLLGDSAVGKSSLVLRFVRGQFFEYQESTIGAAFLTQNVSLNDYTVKFEIWDTAGQERYHSLAPMYYRGAAAAVVVYDITNADSFQRAKSWVKELQRQGSPNIVIALAGNKYDLAQKRKVDTEVQTISLCAERTSTSKQCTRLKAYVSCRRQRSTLKITAYSSWRHLPRQPPTSKSFSKPSPRSCRRTLTRRTMSLTKPLSTFPATQQKIHRAVDAASNGHTTVIAAVAQPS